MPAFTANRGYPYSVPGDPADVPAALQALAEAIDDDVCALLNAAQGRPVARFRGTTPYASPTPTHVPFPDFPYYARRVPFDITDFNTANITLTSQEANFRLIFPEDPGFYFVLATIDVPPLTAAASVAYMSWDIRRGDITNPAPAGVPPIFAGTTTNVPVESHDRNVRVFSTGAGAFMNGTTDAFSIEFFADTSPNVPEYVVNERTVTILKMTES